MACSLCFLQFGTCQALMFYRFDKFDVLAIKCIVGWDCDELRTYTNAELATQAEAETAISALEASLELQRANIARLEEQQKFHMNMTDEQFEEYRAMYWSYIEPPIDYAGYTDSRSLFRRFCDFVMELLSEFFGGLALGVLDGAREVWAFVKGLWLPTK